MENCCNGEVQLEYTIIGGVNGAGKSTIYNSGILDSSNMGVRVNVDEFIQKEYNNQWRDNKVQAEASRHIVKLINECILNKKSFNQETTLAGKSIIKTIKDTKEQGFKVSLHYIGLATPALSIQRVNNRVRSGGHGIDEDMLLRRFTKSLDNLKVILPLCDNVYVYDNSEKYNEILHVEYRKVRSLAENIPDYFGEILYNYINEECIITSEDLAIKFKRLCSEMEDKKGYINKIVSIYTSEFCEIINISAKGAKLIDDFNNKAGRIVPISEIKKLYLDKGRVIEKEKFGSNPTNEKEFNTLKDILKEIDKCRQKEKDKQEIQEIKKPSIELET